MTSEQVQDLNDWMEHRGIPNVHEVIEQNFRKPHALEDNLKFITQGKSSYIQSNVMISLSLMITYIRHHRYSTKGKYFGPFYYIQIDPQDYDEWRTTPPEEELHFQTPSKLGSPTTPRSNVSSEASESYITNRSLLPSGGLMADVPCLDHSLDGCKGYPDDVQTTKHARRTHAWSRRARTSLGVHVSLFGASSAHF